MAKITIAQPNEQIGDEQNPVILLQDQVKSLEELVSLRDVDLEESQQELFVANNQLDKTQAYTEILLAEIKRLRNILVSRTSEFNGANRVIEELLDGGRPDCL